MTPQQIRAAIEARPELQVLASHGATQAIADVLSVGRTKPRRTELGTGTTLAAFNGLGGQFLDTLETIGQTNRDIHWLLQGTILRGVLDTGDAATRAGIQVLMNAQGMTPFVPGLQALLDMGVEPDPVTHTEVGAALQGA